MHLTYVALHEVTWYMVVWCTQNAPRRLKFHVALHDHVSAASTPLPGGFQKRCTQTLVTDAESHASAASLLESGD